MLARATMRTTLPLGFTLAATCLFAAGSALAQSQPDVVVFDEDDATGTDYYDASYGTVSGASLLTRAGPGPAKLIIVTKDVHFSQGAADGITHTLWVDSIRVTTNTALPPAPRGVIAYAGDQSVILHWDPAANLAGYRVYFGAASNGPFARLTSGLLTSPSFAHLDVTNGQTACYLVRAVDSSQQESADSLVVSATPRRFVNDAEFLEYVQHAAFDFFWYEANPANGLIRDRSRASSACSIASVGFGLTAIGIGIDHGWITRAAGRERTLAALRTFRDGPQGTNTTGMMGYRGWFYHFLKMDTGLRSGTTELSSVDTAWLLTGILYAKQYFDGAEPDEAAIRALADEIFNRVDWLWMANGQNSLTMGWHPESGFLGSRWIGYNEAMALYILELGAATNPLPPIHWQSWTSGYTWRTNYGYCFVPFPPLFGHQYSHCWIDFRHLADTYMNAKATTYFENSRRATFAQRAYAIANPGGFAGYGSNVWGLTACDGPGTNGYHGYYARGAPPPQDDDGTIAPTAAGGAMAFTPEVSLPALRHLYDRYRTNIWTAYGFRDAFNLTANWWDPDVIGIDQGPIVLMIENYRTQNVWKRFMRNPEIQRGLQRAGFTRLAFLRPTLAAGPAPGEFTLSWTAVSGRSYQVEYSPDLAVWFTSPTGTLTASNTSLAWLDAGPPATESLPAMAPQRFYRTFQFGPP